MELHPALVHFPIAFYLLELWLLILWKIKHDQAYKRFAYFAFRAAYWIMLAALVSGFVDAGGFAGFKGDVKPHALFAASVLIIATLRGFIWRKIARLTERPCPISLLGLSVIGSVLVILTAFFGGEIVYG